jgi:ADP-ribose pyrophosphatase
VRPETLVRSRRIHVGRVVSLRVDDVRLPDGRSAKREVVDHPGAAVIVPLTDAGEILMVRQYRYAVGEVLLELPAGTLEPGEDPLACARRELAEEVGAAAAAWEPLAVLYPSPGVMTEVMHLFLARGLTEGPPRGTEEEDLAMERLTLPEALERVRRGEIRDAKSVAGVLLAAERTRR